MDKKKERLGSDLVKAMAEALAHMRGEGPGIVHEPKA